MISDQQRASGLSTLNEILPNSNSAGLAVIEAASRRIVDLNSAGFIALEADSRRILDSNSAGLAALEKSSRRTLDLSRAGIAAFESVNRRILDSNSAGLAALEKSSRRMFDSSRAGIAAFESINRRMLDSSSAGTAALESVSRKTLVSNNSRFAEISTLGRKTLIQVTEAWRKSAEVNCVPERLLQNAWDRPLQEIRVSENYFEGMLNGIGETLADLRRQAAKSHSAISRELLDDCQECFQAVAEHGWFLDLNMPSGKLFRIASLVDEDPETAYTALREYYANRFLAMERELINSHPHRVDQLRDAFWAHKEGRFSLSIPAFLIQADGIWHDIFNVSVFMRSGRKTIHVTHSRNEEDSAVARFLSPLGTPLPIWKTESERGESFNDLNRHSELHGESLDNNSEELSLKALSFLWWSHLISVLLNDDEDDSFRININ